MCFSNRSGKNVIYIGLGRSFPCVLFGDGAGAAVLGVDAEGPALLGFRSGADGSNPSLLQQR